MKITTSDNQPDHERIVRLSCLTPACIHLREKLHLSIVLVGTAGFEPATSRPPDNILIH